MQKVSFFKDPTDILGTISHALAHKKIAILAEMSGTREPFYCAFSILDSQSVPKNLPLLDVLYALITTLLALTLPKISLLFCSVSFFYLCVSHSPTWTKYLWPTKRGDIFSFLGEKERKTQIISAKLDTSVYTKIYNVICNSDTQPVSTFSMICTYSFPFYQ